MVYVKLEEDWTDPEGTAHAAGEMVDVDAATLAALEADGIVGGVTTDWVGPTGGGETTAWVGPTSTEP